MFQEYFAGSRLLQWPLVALAIFIAAFLMAVLYAVVGLRGSRKVSELSRMPLEDDPDLRPEKGARP
jgi:hypothetical protein